MPPTDTIAASQASESPRSDGSGSRWRSFVRHPIFPIVAFILLSQIIKEFYPFSHFSMYSKPSAGTLRYSYLADGNGEPLPVTWHTGLSPSRMYKKFGYHKGEGEDRMEETGKSKEEIKAEAATLTLQYLDNRAEKRKGRELPPRVQFVEVSITQSLEGFEETEKVLAEIDTTADGEDHNDPPETK